MNSCKRLLEMRIAVYWYEVSSSYNKQRYIVSNASLATNNCGTSQKSRILSIVSLLFINQQFWLVYATVLALQATASITAHRGSTRFLLSRCKDTNFIRKFQIFRRKSESYPLNFRFWKLSTEECKKRGSFRETNQYSNIQML